jgi:1-deoxy-D-xylulose-5-phosphate synthase
MLADALGHNLVVTVEDGYRDGGAGSHILDALDTLALETGRAIPNSAVLGVPTQFIQHAKPDAILAALGLDAEGIAAEVGRRLGQRT